MIKKKHILFLMFYFRITKNPIFVLKAIFLKLLLRYTKNVELINQLTRKWLKERIVYLPYGTFILSRSITCYSIISPYYESSTRKITYEIVKEIEPKNAIFIDVGAHIRRYVIEFSKYFSKIIPFEPNPYLYKLLRCNIILNDIKEKVKTYNIALNNKNDEVYFKMNFFNDGTSKIIENKEKSNNIIKVKCKRFSDLNLNLGYEKIKLVFIDVEGHEYEVLLRMEEIFPKLPKDCNIILEIHELLS